MNAVSPVPSYPPRHTYPQVRAIVIAAYKTKPKPAPGTFAGNFSGEPSADQSVKRVVEQFVADRQHREQLRIWAWCHEDVIGRGRPRLSYQEGSFREQCDARGWNRDTALRNVERALGMVFLVMNLRDARGHPYNNAP